MTKYLIFILVTVVVLLFGLSFLQPISPNKAKVKPTSPPILTTPSASPTSSLPPSQNPRNDTIPPEQIKIQSEADQDFAEKTKQIDQSYPWLDKLPIQAQKYYAYFDVSEKQFIAKLYPSSSSNIPIDQQVSNLKKEIETKLQNLIPDYSKYNIRWDIKPE